MCVSVCTIAETSFPVAGDFWSKSVSLIPAYLHVLKIFLHFAFLYSLGSLQTSRLCIMGELAGGWSVAVAVGVSDK